MSETQIAEKKTSTPAPKRAAYLRPHYEIAQNKDAYTVRVYVPGVAKDGVKITVEKDTLAIEAARKTDANENWQARYREIPTADYRLRLDLNVPVDADQISAQTANGVLTITLPVAEAAKPRQIAVN
ncbi:Hsp20/alpha crystallin family protein [Cerasicoccus arenae]|uniref:Heat-shock protein Hsp20 n=1 Tax=Cerasicoccus arenae TaxID=424488 RepID=A0A8J3DIU7_9BACT|nr:Hsp20/alpha crystallin family protein [Cerasicoccus arenae]MBK1857590.1 Hsp20/alpha crystallin family protein [Cerasicoccus arenae]GHC05722.1 heat-shock protein Hsp20 [Cerasicoccus arenae]